MNDATLNTFRQIADTMMGDEQDWQWIGRWESQRMFGITQASAEDHARRYGGEAQKMTRSHSWVCNCSTCCPRDVEIVVETR